MVLSRVLGGSRALGQKLFVVPNSDNTSDHIPIKMGVAALAYCAGQISHHLWCDQERTNHLRSLNGS